MIFVKIFSVINVPEFLLNRMMLCVRVVQMREYRGFVCTAGLVLMV